MGDTRRYGWVAVAVIGLAAVLAIVVASRLASSLMDEQMRYNAALISEIVHESRRLYSDEAVGRIKGVNGITVSNRYKDSSGGIPNPATFTILLGERISRAGTLIRMYSDLPFRNREGGPIDQFGRNALAHARANPGEPLVVTAEKDGVRVMRYAGAMVMEQSCVDCHISHPDSPKRDWKVGDVRGVLEVSQPYVLRNESFESVFLTRVALAGIAVLVMAGAGLLVFRIRRDRASVEDEINVRTAVLRRRASIDALTGIANRGVFDDHLRREWAVSVRNKRCLSLILVDVDHFKSYNDEYGHQAGDRCLKTIAASITSCLQRPADLAARYGGEEFGIVLTDTAAKGAMAVAENVRRAVELLDIEHVTDNGRVSLSLGCATICSPSPADAEDMLLKAADEALYRAKSRGRNQVCASE